LSRPGAEALWYRDAIVYALHVKTFFDGNGDGIGDFVGLTMKLDYFTSLGVTCLWLLPFYVSPLRDDGYDIAHYERVDPRYGTLDDFVRFLGEAHRRGLRVMTELVVNHTSDAHPWFQAARRAPAGSPKREFYVWSDTDQRYASARVIFRDVESSNWTWDPVAGAYYWHRFFHHQPDLNFDNPRVRRAVLKVMRFWFDLGVDGLRLDAVAHLYEREGTTCDNLPETHRFLKSIRAVVDRQYQDRVLLAEVNQSPEETRAYFGDGDECHMAFHFPLMPRFFLALQQQDASPIVDIVSRTQNLPPTCQWAVFLRNHDELTLSALSEDDRAGLYEAYAPDPRMRLNHGIRRRLAPLLNNDRRRIELANALLLALPGSPVIYYGDEIGMGDNIHLGDRDGVRTPMQWSGDYLGGFTAATAVSDPVPHPIDELVYGYPTVSVKAQQADPGSLLSAMSRLFAARRKHAAFGRGSIEFLDCGNLRVLGFVRRHERETILVVANLSDAPQAFAAQLGCEPGCMLVDILSGVELPAAGSGLFALTLDPYVCHWFAVTPVAEPSIAGVQLGV
jgi:maltose alpha-D-glucosyltransferase/alpha-amylase